MTILERGRAPQGNEVLNELEIEEKAEVQTVTMLAEVVAVADVLSILSGSEDTLSILSEPTKMIRYLRRYNSSACTRIPFYCYLRNDWPTKINTIDSYAQATMQQYFLTTVSNQPFQSLEQVAAQYAAKIYGLQEVEEEEHPNNPHPIRTNITQALSFHVQHPNIPLFDVLTESATLIGGGGFNIDNLDINLSFIFPNEDIRKGVIGLLSKNLSQ